MNDAYVQSVVQAGGVPVLIPTGIPASTWDEILFHLSGVLITGGGDVDPALFNGEPHPAVYGIDAERDAIEIALVQKSAAANRPLFGICRGIQVMNVALGGTLYTDIAGFKSGALKHDWFPDWPRDYLSHEVTLAEDSQLACYIGIDPAGRQRAIKVNSMHHQGLRNLASSLRPVATAPDGIVEAVELVGHPFGLGVQWHPECLPDTPSMRSLFRSFISAASAYSQG
jgi:putative glutamine amidotransferase